MAATITLSDLLSKRPREAGPEPVWSEALQGDEFRGAWFAWWLRSHGVSADALARATRVSPATMAYLARPTGIRGWSTVTEATVSRLMRGVQVIDPGMTRDELRRRLKLPQSPAWDGNIPGVASVSGPVQLIGDYGLMVTYDGGVFTGLQVWHVGGGLEIRAQDDQGAGVRLGGLIRIEPVA